MPKKRIKLTDFDKAMYEELENYEVVNPKSLAIKYATNKWKVLCSYYKLQELKLCTVWSYNKIKLETKWVPAGLKL